MRGRSLNTSTHLTADGSSPGLLRGERRLLNSSDQNMNSDGRPSETRRTNLHNVSFPGYSRGTSDLGRAYSTAERVSIVSFSHHRRYLVLTNAI